MLRKLCALILALFLLSAWKPGDVLVDEATAAKYEVIEVLGVGTFGEVAKVARILPDGKREDIALKIIRPEKGERPLRGYRFLLGRGTELPVGLLPFEPELTLRGGGGAAKAIAMPLAESVGAKRANYRLDLVHDTEALRSRLRTMETFMIDGLETLTHLLQANVLHGDIKPENLFLHKGKLVFGDLDGAAAIGGIESAWTLKYGAPEIARQTASGATSDLYSFGASLFALMFGDDPLSDYLISVKGQRRGKIPRAEFQKYLFSSLDAGGIERVIRQRFDGLLQVRGLDDEDKSRIERLRAFVSSVTEHTAIHREDGLKKLPLAKAYLAALSLKQGTNTVFGRLCRSFGFF